MDIRGSLKNIFDLSNRVAIITGGAGLLGEKHAEAIAEFGGIPILLDIDKINGHKIAKKISKKFKIDCQFILCDITDELQILDAKNSILHDYNGIDILINNAAINPEINSIKGKNLSRLENFSINQWNLELNVGLTGSMLCSKIFGHEMANKRKGVILNISSDLGIISPDQRIYKINGLSENDQPVKPITYSVIKHGLIGLTKYLATYWANKNVRCNAICPGGIYNNQPKEFVKNLLKLIPLGRMADPNEYKASILFMLSDASKYMNGVIIPIDGGRSIW